MGRKRKGGPAKTERDDAPAQAPAWAEMPRPVFSRLQTAGIVARNLVPLAGVLFLGHSPGHFVLLCVFNLALSIAGIGVVGVAVSMRGSYVGDADRIAGLCTLALVGLVATAALTALFGWALVVFIAQVERSLFDRALFWSALSILLCALPALWQQYDADIRSGLDEAQRRRRDQPQVFIHLLGAGLIFVYTPYAFGLGRTGMTLAAIAITAMFTFRDLRPDLMHRLAPRVG